MFALYILISFDIFNTHETNTANQIMSICISPTVFSVLLSDPSSPSPSPLPSVGMVSRFSWASFPSIDLVWGSGCSNLLLLFHWAVFLLDSHAPFDDGNTSWEMRRQAILFLCKQHSVQLHKPRWCSLYAPSVPRLQACTACSCTRQHDINSSRRENNAVERRGEHQMYAAAARITQLTVVQQTFSFSF